MAKETGKTKRGVGEMPHNLEAEQSLLGCLLLDTKIQVEVASFLRAEDFYSESHKIIFKAMNELIKSNQPVDLVTLSDILDKDDALNKVGGIQYITELANVIPSSANFQKYVDIVTRDSLLRRIIAGSLEIVDECHQSIDKNQALAFAEKTIFDISESEETSTMQPIGAIIPEVMKRLDELSKDSSSYHGIKTKFSGLDNLLNGLHKSDLVIVAARPAVGKTSFSMNIVENVALQGHTCAVFSLEMGREQLAQRMVCSVAEVSMEHALKGRMNKSEWVRIAKARELLSDAKIYIDDSAATTPQEILSKCRRLKRKVGGLDLVMIDYIQLMQTANKRRDDGRQQEVSEISRNLKIMAKELEVPVIALSQLNRAVETRKGRPKLADLRESGAIEQDADIVMFIHRPDRDATEKELNEGTVKPNVAEIIIEKHRNGPTGIVQLFFKGECTKFVDYHEGDENTVKPKTDQNDMQVSEQVSEQPPFDGGVDTNIPLKDIDDEIF